MSVLQRKQLEESPLADLHAIASELGLEGFRAMRKDDLIGAILRAQGDEDEPEPATSIDEPEPDEVPADEALEGPVGEAAAAPEEEMPADEGPAAEAPPAEAETAEEEPAEEEPVQEPAEARAEPEPAEAEAEPEREPEAEAEVAGPPEATVTGVLDILANGSGFVRVDPAGQSRDDVYVAPAQIRRCELRAGDEVGGPVRPPRRNERHPSLVRVESVNGADAEPPEQRPWFGDLTPVFPSARLPAPSSLKAAPFGRGSRVLIAGPPGAGATSLLRQIGAELAKLEDTALQVVLVGVRPEEVTDWRRIEDLDVVGGSFERSPDAQAQAAELAVERAKRVAERGRHAALLIDSLDALPTAAKRRIFGAARATEEGGTLTVVATAGPGSDALRWATTRIVLEPGGKPARAGSGTLHADRLS
jgi:transcription termination factor Rho